MTFIPIPYIYKYIGYVCTRRCKEYENVRYVCMCASNASLHTINIRFRQMVLFSSPSSHIFFRYVFMLFSPILKFAAFLYLFWYVRFLRSPNRRLNYTFWISYVCFDAHINFINIMQHSFFALQKNKSSRRHYIFAIFFVRWVSLKTLCFFHSRFYHIADVFWLRA